MSYVCPNGHDSTAADFCDTCGAKIDAAAQGLVPEAAQEATPEASAPAAPTSLACPNCATENVPESLFCEACGYDFTTGAMPRGSEPEGESESAGEAAPGGESEQLGEPAAGGIPAAVAAPAPTATGAGVPPAIALEWVAEVWIDPDWYAVQEADEPMPSAGLPVVVPLL
ncbi:MAG: zinc ribbon domain-containing protein, partial [Dermatophilaceae bacterium]|nr:zinc ribbon domain-containing protein [Dermatophilaceae bacterium]